MQVVYQKLFDKLKANGITQKDFRTEAGISGTTMSKLINNDSITTNSICKICDYFNCMPDEIMEFIPDKKYFEKQKAKENLENQIAELQAKLKNL